MSDGEDNLTKEQRDRKDKEEKEREHAEQEGQSSTNIFLSFCQLSPFSSAL
jgi:hypothetical protein